MPLKLKFIKLPVLFGIGIVLMASSGIAAPVDYQVPPDAYEHIAKLLDGRKVSNEMNLMGVGSSGSLRSIFRKRVKSVPLVIGKKGIGSSAVLVVRKNKSVPYALLITNHHVIKNPVFLTKKTKTPMVGLLFHSNDISREIFKHKKFIKCMRGKNQSLWCRAIKENHRFAMVLGSDQEKDLALLYVRNPPDGVTKIEVEKLNRISTGDEVAVIGHPHKLLWTLTRGIVSGIRDNYPMGKATGTVIQTDASINPGNSGGPLLSADGDMVGVVAWSYRKMEGLNAAIGINEVVEFFKEEMNKTRKK
jgi:hypothetical protein